MMEGISSEAASFAGHQQLSNLCWIYDSNRVTIEGHTDITFTEDVAARFTAYGWYVTEVRDANDLEQVERAFQSAKAEHERPSLIVVHSHIGYGSPVEDSPKAHGEPFGVEGVKATKRFLGLPEDVDFYVPDEVYRPSRTGWAPAARRPHGLGDALRRLPGRAPRARRRARAHPAPRAAGRLGRRPPDVPADPKGIASRDSSSRC